MNYNREGSRDLSAFVATIGTQLDPVQAVGITLATGITYYLPLGDDLAPVPSEISLVSVHIKWNAAFIGNFSIETCGFPTKLGGGWPGQFDVSDFDTAPGNWIRETPSAADVAITSTDGSTGNATIGATPLIVVVGGGTAGGCMYHLGNFGTKRMRVKAVCTTGGVVRASRTGKNAA